LTALVDSGAPVEPARLADEDISLDSLVAVR
jgi:hypothetical protein